MKRKLKDRRAIVTGASSGIGFATALELARHGVHLVAVARREDRLRQLVDRIAPLGVRIETVAGDMTDPQTRQRALDAAQEKLGGLDILMNNAGVGALGPFADASVDRARRVMEINFFATVEMTRLALPALRRGVRPIIINVGSIVGRRGVPNRSEYSASKFAVCGFSEAIRAEFASQGIDVLLVNPGPTETEFFEKELERTIDAKWPKHTPVRSDAVARQVVRAIRRGRHEIIPYGWGRVLCWLNRLSPRLMDAVLAHYA
ncbi:MAG: SDR family NAD(P)-dependent oxidoreductase [Planctomycetaceae bacterium]|nr:SDR family NAD(P)-dependent oxidoreductase [Planctomycetaceae bacterium]